MKVLLIASDKNELKGFDDRYIKAISGVGLVMAGVTASLEILEHRPDVVISIGSAGSVGNMLKIGECYSFSSIVTPDQDLTAFHMALGSTLDSNRTTFGKIYTSDRTSGFILASSGTYSKDTRPWHETLKPDAVDMEAYGVAYAAFKTKTPFYAIKLITDSLGDNSTIGRIQFNLRDGRDKLLNLVEATIFK